MVDRGKGGSIVMVSSQSSIRAIDGHSVYCSSKAALDQLARCLALELGPHKVTVNDIVILAIILVPLIMTLSRGHTGQIKRTVIMR